VGRAVGCMMGVTLLSVSGPNGIGENGSRQAGAVEVYLAQKPVLPRWDLHSRSRAIRGAVR
jgi:hypothetical protein